MIRALKADEACDTDLVLPIAHSTQPSSGPNDSVGALDCKSERPSSLRDWSRALKRNSRSGIEGDGGLIVVAETESGR